MKLNNRQLVDKYVVDTPHAHTLPPQYGAVRKNLINVYLSFFIYFIVIHNDPKRVKMFS